MLMGASGAKPYTFLTVLPSSLKLRAGSLKIIAISPCSLKLNRLSAQLPKTTGRASERDFSKRKRSIFCLYDPDQSALIAIQSAPYGHNTVCMVKPHCSNFMIITAIFSVSDFKLT